MLFRIDPTSSMGLADQIAAQVRGDVAAGRLAPGDKLPAAREVAAGLDVNMHTVLRAYSQLRDEGLVDLRRGRGAHIREGADHLVQGAASLAQRARELVEAAERLGVSREELLDIIRKAQS